MVNRALLGGLRDLGIKSGMRLLAHSSYRSLGPAANGPASVIDTLIEAVGKDGTLLMPALSFASVNAEHPYFDVRSTPSCVGAIPEMFRRRPGVRRSLHPTHSVSAIGKDAEEMLGGHHLDDTPAGARSPYRRLRDMGGKLLLIGCGLRPNTSMHGVEELTEPPYLFLPGHVTYTCVDKEGRSHALSARRHNFKQNGMRIEQRYDRVTDVLSGEALLCKKVLAAECFLLDAPSLWKSAEAVLEEDPLYFVDYPEDAHR